MSNKISIVVIAILTPAIFFMIAAWARFSRLEDKALELEADVYILKLVQQELLERHGLSLDVKYRGELARRLGKEDANQLAPAITINGGDDSGEEDEEEEEEPVKKKKRKHK